MLFIIVVADSHAFINFSLQPFSIDVGYERFLGPEIFFHPEVRIISDLCRARD